MHPKGKVRKGSIKDKTKGDAFLGTVLCLIWLGKKADKTPGNPETSVRPAPQTEKHLD